MTDMTTFTALRQANRARNATAEKFRACRDWTIADWSNALCGEAGELANMVKKIRRGDQVDGAALMKEAGDVLTYLDLLCDKLGFRLDEALVMKFNEVSAKIGSEVVL